MAKPIRERIHNFLLKHPDKYYTPGQITKLLKLNIKSVAAQMPKLAVNISNIKRKKSGKGKGFMYASITSSSDKGLVPAKEIEIKETLEMPSLLSLESSDLSSVIVKLVKTDQQNQMYKQVLGQMASLLEQAGFVVSE